jgi:hypothetical protein
MKIKNRKKEISSINIQQDFAILSNGGTQVKENIILEMLRNIYILFEHNKIKGNQFLYTEWENLFKFSEKDKKKESDVNKRIEIFTKMIGIDIKKEEEHKVLFSLHTTLNIIIKLFLAKFANFLKKLFPALKKIENLYETNDILKLKKFMKEIESGEYFKQINITNLNDGNFFSWYLSEEWNKTFLENLKKVIMLVDTYDIDIRNTENIISGDLFKGLYENFIPKIVRHSFGEYHTPSYLAKYVLERLKIKDEDYISKKFIDPCCGSGTFILELYNKKLKAIDKKIDFQDFLNGIAGVDINPLSVLITKANIFINSINKVTFDTNKKYEIPIYNCDSLFIPRKIKINEIECYSFSLKTVSVQEKLELMLPVQLVRNKDFINIFQKIEKNINELNIKKIQNELKKHIDNFKEIEKELEEKFINIIEIKRKNSDFEYFKTFYNYFKLASYEKFDYIVGNPAWVRWADLPETYKENLKNNIDIRNIFNSSKSFGGVDLNFCILLANKCCERWFDKKSKLAYLMPKNIIYSDSFEGFRKLIIKNNEKLKFEEIDDFSKCGEIFEGTGNLEFSLYIIAKNKNDESDYIPFNILRKKEENFDIMYKNKLIPLGKYINKNNFLELKENENIKDFEKYIGTCEYKFRKGVGTKVPMRFVWDQNIDENLAFFHPLIKKKKLYEIDKSRKIKLEKKFLFPLVTGPMLKTEWENLYVILLYENGKKQPLELKTVKKEVPNIYNWIIENKKELESGSEYDNRIQNKPYWGLLRIGEYTFKERFVCIRDNTSLSSKIITKLKTHWNEMKIPIFDAHINYISYRRKISEDLTKEESKYIFNILNKKIVSDIILNSQSSRSISSNIPIKIKYFK